MDVDSFATQFLHLNEDINFVTNHSDNVARVIKYATLQKWTLKPADAELNRIIEWLRYVKPVHRCQPNIFESIVLHGHVMSREYMEKLKEPRNAVESVLRHRSIRRIKYLQTKHYAEHAKTYITKIVYDVYRRQRQMNSHVCSNASDGSSKLCDLSGVSEENLSKSTSDPFACHHR